MLKISRNKQIIFYIAILIFGIFFFFYFYKQAAITENDFLEVNVSDRQTPALVNKQNSKIDLGLFDSDKFKNLRAEVAPIQNFQTGKRNPFLPSN